MDNQISEARSGVVSGVLPCGYLDSNGELQADFVVDELDGYDEDALAGSGPVLTRLNKVIVRRLQKIGAIEEKPQVVKVVQSLLALDRMMLLLAIRRATHGDIFRMNARCPAEGCGEEFRSSVDLSQLDVTPMDNPKEREFEHTLCRGTVVKWRVMVGSDEEWLTSTRKDKRMKADQFTLAFFARVTHVNGEEIVRSGAPGLVDKSRKLLKSMKSSERNELRNVFMRHEGNIDTELEFSCPSCGQEWKGELDVGQPDFFFPAEE